MLSFLGIYKEEKFKVADFSYTQTITYKDVPIYKTRYGPKTVYEVEYKPVYRYNVLANRFDFCIDRIQVQKEKYDWITEVVGYNKEEVKNYITQITTCNRKRYNFNGKLELLKDVQYTLQFYFGKAWYLIDEFGKCFTL